jgi:hypothetical protein
VIYERWAPIEFSLPFFRKTITTGMPVQADTVLFTDADYVCAFLELLVANKACVFGQRDDIPMACNNRRWRRRKPV